MRLNSGSHWQLNSFKNVDHATLHIYEKTMVMLKLDLLSEAILVFQYPVHRPVILQNLIISRLLNQRDMSYEQRAESTVQSFDGNCEQIINVGCKVCFRQHLALR